MDCLLVSKSLPPGFRFHPTDEELCMYYLKRKVMGKPLGVPMLSELEVYKHAPWDLPSMACIKTRDLSWYFFCPRGSKSGHGGRANRGTGCGYWKSTGIDRNVQYKCRTVGKIKTLVFYIGKAPKGERTDWVMHEYRLKEQVLFDMGVSQDTFVICKVYQKSGPGPRNGEFHGAHFVEEEWESDDDDNGERDHGVIFHSDRTANGKDAHASLTVTASENVSHVTMDTCKVSTSASTIFDGASSQNVHPATNFMDISAGTCAVNTDNAAAVALSTIQKQAPFASDCCHSDVFAVDELDSMLAMFTEDELNLANEVLNSDIFNGLEDLENGYLELDDLK